MPAHYERPNDDGFSPAYRWATSIQNPRWRRLRRISFAVTLGRCTLIPVLKAHHNDHLTYRNLGRELPLRDVVPLNRHVHAAVTFLRARGLKRPANIILRTAYTAWIGGWILFALKIANAVGLIRFDVLDRLLQIAKHSVTF